MILVLQIAVGDYFGYAALLLIAFTAVLMLVRKTLLRHVKNLDLLRRVHLAIATLGGVFLILHAAYFLDLPVSNEVALGYVAAGAALFVWLTGTAFLERLRDSLFYHGSMSLVAVGLMVVHAAGSGINIPAWAAEATLAAAAGTSFWKAWSHAGKALK